MDKFLSNKLKAISFLLMIMVVFVHSFNLIGKVDGKVVALTSGYAAFIENFISQGITRTAVPLFFAISGYLFFLSIKSGAFSEFVDKYKKRAVTLLIPYIIWAIYGTVVFFILQEAPFSKSFFTSNLIKDFSLGELLYNTFIDPFQYQLWFIRDLLLMILFSPLIYWLLRKAGFIIIPALFVVWFLFADRIEFSLEGLFFFSMGGLLAIKKANVQNVAIQRQWLILLVVWLLLVSVKTYFLNIGFENEVVLLIMHKASILIGVVAIWTTYDTIFRNRDITTARYFGIFQFSFFLYAFHEPLLYILKKVFGMALGKSESSLLLIYFTAPIVTIIIAIITAGILKKIAPKLYGLITGGR